MNPSSQLHRYSAAVLLIALLGGCAAGASSYGPMAGMGGGSHQAMDMQSMCEMHNKMMGSKPSAEQQAMMNEHMKSMSPEMRARMQAMHEQCKSS
jgi:PBP1b-binding outer membrane lipoprotein LpoB